MQDALEHVPLYVHAKEVHLPDGSLEALELTFLTFYGTALSAGALPADKHPVTRQPRCCRLELPGLADEPATMRCPSAGYASMRADTERRMQPTMGRTHCWGAASCQKSGHMTATGSA